MPKITVHDPNMCIELQFKLRPRGWEDTEFRARAAQVIARRFFCSHVTLYREVIRASVFVPQDDVHLTGLHERRKAVQEEIDRMRENAGPSVWSAACHIVDEARTEGVSSMAIVELARALGKPAATSHLEAREAGDLSLLARNREMWLQLLRARELLSNAATELSWCGGSGDFAPEGKAREGWLKGPAVVREQIESWLDSTKGA